MNNKNSKKGMALVLVLILSIFLLVLGSTYIRVNSSNRPINRMHFERLQADFLGQGIVQLAAMKLKKRPAEFYFAYLANKANNTITAPINSYLQSDPTLNGTFTDKNGKKYDYSTQIELITNNKFTNDGIRITITVHQLATNGTILLTRKQEHVLDVTRKHL